jgi:hypothetical protein
VRIRWYDSDVKNNPAEIPFYLEIKQREGFASSKQRRKFLLPTPYIKPVHEGILNKTMISRTLASMGYFPEKSLRPVIVISYKRYRFSEIQTGVRVSFDRDIRASVVAADLGRQSRQVRLETGVLEVKGPSIDLPVTLRRLRFLNIDWSRFSKYGNCLDAYFAQTGDIY